MPLTVRTLTNVGDPITYQDGDPAAGEQITFQLADATGTVIDGWDDTSGEHVVSIPTVVTLDASGEFSQALWPTDRSMDTIYYLCTFFSEGTPPRLGTLPSGVGSYLWIDFMQNSIPVPEA